VKYFPSCREVSQLLSQAQDRPLGMRERFAIHVHLPLCEACRNFRAQLDILRAAMRRYIDRGDGSR
jgi:hypothetical protein